MRISDWSSDVCSSDLKTQRLARLADAAAFKGRDACLGGGQGRTRVGDFRLGVGENTVAPRFSRLNFGPRGCDVALVPIKDRQRHRKAGNQCPVTCFAQLAHPHTNGRVKTTLRAGLAQLRISNDPFGRSEEHTSELQSLMRISYAVFCLK